MRGGLFQDGAEVLQLQIHYAAAFLAQQMVVGRDVCVETVYAVAHIQPADFPGFG